MDREDKATGDAYSFLHTVRGDNLTIPNTSCLRVEIDHFDMTNENEELPESPENNFSFEKPSFGTRFSLVFQKAISKIGFKTQISSWVKIDQTHQS